MQTLVPSADFCFGRDMLIQRLKEGLNDSAAALLFGGRLSGKTTVLLRWCETAAERGDVRILGIIDVPIYVNLMRLEPHDGPAAFWRLLSRRLAQVCSERIKGFRDPLHPTKTEGGSLDTFELDFVRVQAVAGEVKLRVTFLIDETKRIFGPECPHGLQDNIFALLFGSESPASGSVGMVFAGAQDLYEVFLDRTSPIGSRARQYLLTNLDLASLTTLLTALAPSENQQRLEVLSDQILIETGGHAGLSRFVASHWNELLCCENEAAMRIAVQELLKKQLNLMQIWNSSLSPAAGVVRDRLTSTTRLRLADAANALDEHGQNRYLAGRAFEELTFTGVAAQIDGDVVAVNQSYWTYVAQFGVSASRSDPVSVSRSDISDDVWKLIHQAEVEFREHVKELYQRQWSNAWEARMEDALGKDAWAVILQNRAKAEKQYPYASEKITRDVMESMYLGQLLILMIHRNSWQLFRNLFKDKRHAEELFNAIAPVRNDTAHFRAVPETELARCLVACSDLLVLLRKEQGRAATGCRQPPLEEGPP